MGAGLATLEGLASLAHVAMGLVLGRVHGGRSRRRAIVALLVFPCLALLPDLDVIGPALGLPDGGLLGHRGVSHSLLAALIVAALVAATARRFGFRPAYTGVFVLVAVASHGLLDAATDGAQPVPLLWPLSTRLIETRWQPIPVPPRGIDLLSLRGLEVALIELIYFLPLVLYALWPRRQLLRVANLRIATLRAGLVALSAVACMAMAELVLRDTRIVSRLEVPERLRQARVYRAGSGPASRIHLDR